MKTQYGICRGCDNNRPIVNMKYYLCPICNRKRLHPDETSGQNTPIKQKRFSEKFPYDTRWGFTTEMGMYYNIADNRPQESFFTGEPIKGTLAPGNFAHVLAKGINQYPHFRFNPDNMVLATMEEHHIIDNGTEEQKKALPNWKGFTILKLRLIAEYIKLFGDPKYTIQKIQQ